MEKQLPKLMPAHESKNITLEQARAAWLKVMAREEARQNKRKTRAKRPADPSPQR